MNKNFNALLEEKLLKVDDLARNVDRISLEIDSLKLISIPPKHDINESLKDCFVKACSSSFHDNNDEDLKVIDVSPIKYLFCNMNLDNDGTEDDLTLPRRLSKNSLLALSIAILFLLSSIGT